MKDFALKVQRSTLKKVLKIEVKRMWKKKQQKISPFSGLFGNRQGNERQSGNERGSD